MATKLGYDEAEPCWLTKPQIHNIAESIADRLEFEPGDDLNDLVSTLGGKVKVQATLLQDPEHTGSLYVNGLNDFEIIVPSHTSLLRDRFTVAHELGHYFLHYVFPKQLGKPIPEKVMALRRGTNRIEWEANWFAAAFLMPAAEFKSAHIKAGGDIAAVAKEFDVSTRAASVRAEDLGL